MPRIDIFVRKDDLEDFLKIEKRGEWLHEAIVRTKDNVHIHIPEKIADTTEKPGVHIHIPPIAEEPAKDSEPHSLRDAEDYTSRLIPDEGNKHRAYDPEFEEYVRVKWVKGKMVRVEETA
jgi:hypothetical protein